MIRVIRDPDDRKHPGVWHYRIMDFPGPGEVVEGRSKQPLLDACRIIKRILAERGTPLGGDASRFVGLFRKGMIHEAADICCTVESGARTSVFNTGNGPKFGPFHPDNRWN